MTTRADAIRSLLESVTIEELIRLYNNQTPMHPLNVQLKKEGAVFYRVWQPLLRHYLDRPMTHAICAHIHIARLTHHFLTLAQDWPHHSGELWYPIPGGKAKYMEDRKNSDFWSDGYRADLKAHVLNKLMTVEEFYLDTLQRLPQR